MKLSELNAADVTVVTPAEAPAQTEGPAPLRLSEISPDAVKLVQRGAVVYDKPVGPEQATAFDRFKARVSDPERWRAILTGEGPYARKDIVQGDAPLVIPAGTVPRLAKAATALAEGKGLGFAAARTALSAGQGAAMSAMDRKEGESWGDTADRMKSGAKLSGGIQIAAEAVPYVGKALGWSARKLSSATSGIDENLIQNYSNRTDEVNQLIKENGGDITAAADQVRSELASGIQSAKRKLNGQISAALDQAAPETSVSVQPIIERLEAAKSKLNPNFKAGAIADIDDMIAAIKSEAKDGSVGVSSLYQIKQFLNEGSASAYNKGGQIFTRAGEAARAAKDAAGQAREMLKPVASAISEADAQLSKLHAIERRLNKNLLAAGKPDGALMAAGSGANPRNAANLRELERISGVPVSQRARDLATAREFANPSLLPVGSTGKVVGRMAVGAGLGYMADGNEGAAIGSALASPMALKVGINALSAGRQIAGHLPNVARTIRQNPVASTAVTQLVAGQIRRANEPDQAPEGTPMEGAPRLMDAPKTGPERWARSGLEKLGISDQELASRLLQSKEGKRLLIEASDLPKGSPRLMRIMDQIEKGWVTSHGNESPSRAPSEVLRRRREPAGGR